VPVSDIELHPILKKIADSRDKLTPKGRILGDYILANPRKVIFMTIKELSSACGVSEATVVRFVGQLGCSGYGSFLQDLRELVDTKLTLLDRMELTNLDRPGADLLRRVVHEEIDNLKSLFQSVDLDAVGRIVGLLDRSPCIFVIGSRLSYTLAYYMGWSLTKLTANVRILKGSDRTSIDWLTIAPENSLVILFATTRYPNELIRIGKLVRRLNHTLIVLADSKACPLNQFANEALIAPSRFIPLFGSPTTLSCLVNYLIQELAGIKGESAKRQQAKLEQSYREHDILFNLDLDG
jgi:DNA-binding MurR/RpiR family transcriptional regulator